MTAMKSSSLMNAGRDVSRLSAPGSQGPESADRAIETVFPIIVAEWQRNSREIVRVALDRYNGVETVDVRAWWRDDNGNWRPGRSGLTLSVKHLPALSKGLGDALQRVRVLGLVEVDRQTANRKDKTAAERQRRYRDRHRNAAP
jgi:Transcriptional Coactivator p15 (PC4)